MATPTVKKQAQEKSDKKAQSSDLVYDALKQVTEFKDVLKQGELLQEVGRLLKPAELASIMAAKIKDRTEPGFQRRYLRDLLDLQKSFEARNAEISETQVSKLLDEQIDGLLATEYEIVRRGDHSRTSGPPEQPSEEEGGGGGSSGAADADSGEGESESDAEGNVAAEDSPVGGDAPE